MASDKGTDHATIGPAWTTSSSDVTATPGTVPAATLGLDGDWQTTTTTALGCTANGTATLTVAAGSEPDIDTHLTQLTLHVTVSENAAQYRTSGGVVGRRCRWTNAIADLDGLVEEMDCGFYDTERPEGRIVDSDPRGLNGMTPLAAPFLSFTDDAAGRLVSADLTVGATARGSCTAATAAGFDKAYRCTMTRGDSLEVSVTADANTTGAAIGWTAGTGVTVSAGVSRPAAQQSSPDGAVSLWQRTRTAAIGCTATGTATITVTLPDAADYTARISIACEAPSAIVISGLGDAQARGDATVSVPGSFEVSPGTASCTASALPGSASTGGEGNSRTVTAAVASGTSATVTVTCSQAPLPAGTATALFTAAPADGCNTPLGVLPEGVTTASGTVAADAACTTAHRYRTASRRTYYARRHTFSLDAAASVTIDLADADTDAESLDTYLVLLARGDAGAVARLDADDDSGDAGGDSRLADSGLAAGGYTIVATSFGPGRTGAYTLSVDVAYDAEVQIAGLDSTARVGDVDVTDTFTVTPAAATCTAESSVGTATVAPLTGATRTVTLPMTAPASATVTVACRAADHADGIARAIFAVTEPAEVASVTLTSGGACTAAPEGLPDGVDQALACTVDEGDPVTVNVTSLANRSEISLAWATSSSDVTAAAGTVPDATLGLDGNWHLTAPATLGCTADGTATLTVTAGSDTDTGTHITQVTVACGGSDAVSDVRVTAAGRGTCVTSSATGFEGAYSCTMTRGDLMEVSVTADATADGTQISWTAGTGVTVTEGAAQPATQILAPGSSTSAWRQTRTAQIACTADGSATVTASLTGASDHDTQVSVECEEPTAVLVAGLLDAEETGHGTVEVSGTFEVSPGTAGCTASTDAGTASVDGDGNVRTVTARIASGTSATVSVTCRQAPLPSDTATAVFTALEPVSVEMGSESCSAVSPAPEGADAGYSCPLSNEHRLEITATAEAASRRISMRWSAETGATITSRAVDAVSATGDRWERTATATVSCSGVAVRTLTLTVTAGSGDSAEVHTSTVSIDCVDQGAVTGLEDTPGSGTATVTVSDGFSVTPVSAVCLPSATQGTASVGADPDGTAGDLILSVGLEVTPGADASTPVSVDCTPPGHAPVTASATFTAVYSDSCDSPLGVLADGVTERSGTIVTSAVCQSPQRRTDGGAAVGYYARRHTFELTNPATVTIDLESASSNRRRLDTYVLLLKGQNQDGTGTVLGRNDDRAPGDYDSRLTDKKLSPGRYTIEATAYGARKTGDYDLTVTAQLEVLIEGLNGGSVIGTGTAKDYFTVTPADASCTPTSGAVADVDDDGRQVLSVDLTALGDTDVTVECSYTGYDTASATTTLRALVPISSVEVDADSGGVCRLWSGTLDAGVDQKFACTMTRGDTLVVGVEASGPSSRMTLGWAAGTGVTVEGADGDLGAAVLEGEVQWIREGTGTISCTADGTVALTVEIDEVVEHATQIAVTCVPPVEITSFVPGARDGAGAMSGSFDVVPTTAACTASNVGGIAGRPTAGGSGGSRTVAVTTTDTGRLNVAVECEADGYETATVPGWFVARTDADCTSPLGRLSHGPRSLSASLSTASCTTASRISGSTFYVRRYTFTVASSGWVSIDLEATGTGTNALDTYLMLLDGHGSGGQVQHSDDNSGTDDDAQLTDVFLAAGDYTIEATTAAADATGGYRLTVTGDFAVQSDDLPLTVTATVGHASRARFDYLPADATVTVGSISPEGLTASVTAVHGSAAVDLTPDKARTTTVTLAFTASGHTSTEQITVTAGCQTGYRPLQDGTCQPLSQELPDSCIGTSLLTALGDAEFAHRRSMRCLLENAIR